MTQFIPAGQCGASPVTLTFSGAGGGSDQWVIGFGGVMPPQAYGTNDPAYWQSKGWQLGPLEAGWNVTNIVLPTPTSPGSCTVCPPSKTATLNAAGLGVFFAASLGEISGDFEVTPPSTTCPPTGPCGCQQ